MKTRLLRNGSKDQPAEDVKRKPSPASLKHAFILVTGALILANSAFLVASGFHWIFAVFTAWWVGACSAGLYRTLTGGFIDVSVSNWLPLVGSHWHIRRALNPIAYWSLLIALAAIGAFGFCIPWLLQNAR